MNAASQINAARSDLLTGTLFAMLAGAVWGLVFVIPLLLPDYPAAWLSVGRYVAFGLIALPIAWFDRKALLALTRSDWLEALKLSAVGNLLYYLLLAAAIQRAGGPLPTMIIGTLPVVIALCANARSPARDGQLPWSRLGPSLAMIASGIALVNYAEMQQLRAETAGAVDWSRYGMGALLAIGAVVCWTWYPLRNADWLREHATNHSATDSATDSTRAQPPRSPRTWATAQGVVTLPLALVAGLAFWAWSVLTNQTFALPGGPTPERFVLLMLAAGLLASWLGTLCWNEASQRLPTHLVGQLIVFETLAALAYALILRGVAPSAFTWAGMALLFAGVLWALRAVPVAQSSVAAESIEK